MNDDFLLKKLNLRRDENAYRRLEIAREGMIDFYSNDYLGIVRNNLLPNIHGLGTGSTGSRLLSGNNQLVEEVEAKISNFHQSPTGLIFNSGFDANMGLLSSVPQRGDTVIYDFLSHASIRDGIRLSNAQSFPFMHNDLDDLEKKLKVATRNIFVVTETVFSMDGDICPLIEMVELCEKYGANLVVDEAHATGVIGKNGEGLVQQNGLQERVFARIHTFGKGCGCHGAIILGSAMLREYLINFSRPFIYSTALPPETIAHISAAYDIFPGMNNERKQLEKLASLFREASIQYTRLESRTPIQGILVNSNEGARKLAARFQENRLDVRPILYPSVPKGGERLRIVLHAFNNERDLELLLNCLKNSS
jgi:8-amino-7-oxononanoate synthase